MVVPGTEVEIHYRQTKKKKKKKKTTPAGSDVV